MKLFLLFVGKELKEHMRTHRLTILGAVFLLFGIMSPALTKYTPELLQAMGGSTGMQITLPPVTVLDSYVQFFKNISGIAMLVLLLMTAGTISDEKTKGSTRMILTKNLSRPAFVLAKYAALAVLWTAVFACSALVCQAYTLWFFPGEAVNNLLVSLAMFWVYGLVLLSFAVLASAAAPGNSIAMLGAFAGWGLLMLSAVPQEVGKVSPQFLGSVNVQLISGAVKPDELLLPVIVSAAVILLALSAASVVFSRQEL